MRLLLCCAAIIAALVVGGCGDDSSPSADAGDDRTAATTTRTAPPQEVIFYVNKYPKPRNPGPHPGARINRLIIRDVRVGTGPEIHAGDSGIFEFIATNWVTGKPLESAWHKRRPFETQIEKNVVIDGWWQGIPGMRVGGRRQITVPPELGFTTSPVVGLPEATTYFDVVLNQVNPQQPSAMAPPRASGGAATPSLG
jgi:peptidylprolyl isomerase